MQIITIVSSDNSAQTSTEIWRKNLVSLEEKVNTIHVVFILTAMFNSVQDH